MLKQKKTMSSVHFVNNMWCTVTKGYMFYRKLLYYVHLSHYLYLSLIKPQQSRAGASQTTASIKVCKFEALTKTHAKPVK